MRRRSTTPAEDLFHIASRLPWWGSVLNAAGAWFAFQPIANSQPVAITDLHEFSSLVSGQAFCAFGQLWQFLLSPIFLIGAVISVIDRIRRRRLQEDVANVTQPGKALDGICWQQFERLAGEFFLMRRVAKRGINGMCIGESSINPGCKERYLAANGQKQPAAQSERSE